MAYTLTLAERETIIRYDAETRRATIDTAIPADIRKLDKLAEVHPDVYKLERIYEEYGAKRYSVPARYIRFGKPASEAQKESARRNSRFSR